MTVLLVLWLGTTVFPPVVPAQVPGSNTPLGEPLPGESPGGSDSPGPSDPLSPEEVPGDRITLRQFQFEGLSVWSEGDVMPVLGEVGLNRGDTLTVETLRKRVNRAIKQLQDEGLFSDVRVQRNDGTLTFSFEEFPRVTKITFRGNRSFGRSKLMDVLLLQENDPANPFNLRKSRDELMNFYEQQGYRDATVEYEQELTDPGKAQIIYRIDEGRRRSINEIEFQYEPPKGPLEEVIRNWNLRVAIPVKPGSPYSKQAEQLIGASIMRWYRNRGYLDASVDVKAWRNLRKGGIDLTVTIQDGPKYFLGDVTFRGNQVFGDTVLRNQISLDQGDVFSAREFKQGVDAVEAKYKSRGYANAHASSPSFEKVTEDVDRPRVNLTVQVDEGDPVYVERIEIHGNVRTYERVIRREIRLEPGELLDGEKKENSLRRLRNLGYFKKVKMNVDPGSQENWKIVRVQVQEGRTGQFQFGGGFSSSAGFVGQLSVRKDNFSLYDYSHGFTGRGQSLQASVSVGERRSNFNVSWDDPWINDDLDDHSEKPPERPIGFGFSAFSVANDFEEGFDQFRDGGAVRFSSEFGPARSNRAMVEYRFRQTRLEDLDLIGFNFSDPDNIPFEFLREAQTSGDTSTFDNTIGSLQVILERDRRDNRLFPTEGYYLQGSLMTATEFLGGDRNFYSPSVDMRSYIPFTENTFWALRFDYETLDSWKGEGDNSGVPSTEKIFLGGNRSVRGYDYRDIAVYRELDECVDNPGAFPQISNPNQLVRCSGGQTAFFANLEFRVEAITNTMQLFAFADVGNVYRDSFDLGFSDTKKSAGIGLRVRSPMGPINISWASRIEETFPGADDSGESQIDFNIGTGF